jgi:glycerol-3-phosphate dehydrogenase
MRLRDHNLRRIATERYDALVVGAGVNGAAAAAALSTAGLKVALIDRGDFASGTSQESSNLAWGGLKYLESLDLPLVRQLCLARNELLRRYPSSIREVRFLVTVPAGFRRSRPLLWLGAWLYWLLGNGATRPPRWLSRREIEQQEPLINSQDAAGALEYSDALFVDGDTRFVLGLVRSAMDRGCTAVNYVESLGARRGTGGVWATAVRDLIGGRATEIRSKILVNAAGPFADEHNTRCALRTVHHHVFSKGIHLTVEPVIARRRVLGFFASDGRPFFAVPLGGRTCIGTTDTSVEGPSVRVTDQDRRFLLENANACLKLSRPLAEGDVIGERCGVRPLVVKGRSVGHRERTFISRRHVIEADRRTSHVTIFGGKLTDCINVGNELVRAVDRLGLPVPCGARRWYGEAPSSSREAFMAQARAMRVDRHAASGATEPLAALLWRRYGEEAGALLDAIRRDPRQTEPVVEGAGYMRCELQHAARREMVVKLEDLLRRRTLTAMVTRRGRLESSPGLLDACRRLFGGAAQERLDEYFQGR